MAKILVVDDEQHIVELVKFNLEKEGHEVVVAYDGERALEQMNDAKPSLVVLDIMLPKMDGLDVCRNIRMREPFKEIPIIMLTAKGEELDKVLGLEMGADDYLTKPFSPRELVARVKALLRRSRRTDEKPAEEGAIVIGPLQIKPEKFEVIIRGEKQDLTPKEFELLKILANSPGKVFTREFLLERVWGYDFFGDSRTVDVHIRHIRQKIEDDPSNPQYVETIRGVGYKFKEQNGS